MLNVREHPVELLKPYENNAKIHPPEQVEQVANSIGEFGWTQPLVIDKDFNVVIGHCRLLAAKKLKQKYVPCVVADSLTDEQIRALRLADNKTSESDWDFDVLDLELDAISDIDMSDFGFELSLSGDDDAPGFDDDEFDEDIPPGEPRAKRGNMFRLGSHVLMCGDSTSTDDVARLMDGARARLCITSPPYGVGKEYETGVFEDWRKTITDTIKTITKHALVICWNIADLSGTGTQFIKPTGAYSVNIMEQHGFDCLYVRIWKKPGAKFGGANPYQTVTMKPVQEYEYIYGFAKADYLRDFGVIQKGLELEAKKANLSNKELESITGAKFMHGHWFTPHQWHMIDEKNYSKIQAYCVKNGFDAFATPYKELRRQYDNLNVYQKELSKEEMSEWGQWGIWEIAPVTSRDGHPAAYPAELPARCIKMHSREGDIVLDPFGGSGTTLIVCEQLNRCCYMMEISEKYCDVIIDRWERFTGQTAELVEI